MPATTRSPSGETGGSNSSWINAEIKLPLRQLRIETTFSNQTIMHPFGDNPSAINDNDSIGLPDRRETMCNDDAGPRRQYPFQRLLDQVFRFRIESARRLIQQ